MVVVNATRVLLASTEQQTVLEQLDPGRRAAVVMALVGLGMLGALLLALVMLGGRWARQDRPQRRAHRSEHRPRQVGRAVHPQITEYVAGETVVRLPPDEDTKS